MIVDCKWKVCIVVTLMLLAHLLVHINTSTINNESLDKVCRGILKDSRAEHKDSIFHKEAFECELNGKIYKFDKYSRWIEDG